VIASPAPGFVPDFDTERGVLLARVQLRRWQFELAEAGDTRMLIHLGRCLLGQSDHPGRRELEGGGERITITISNSLTDPIALPLAEPAQ